jgi:hypothetical protein
VIDSPVAIAAARWIPASMLELLGGIYPDLFSFHPNWKGGQSNPAIVRRTPVADHVDPGSTGGNWTSVDNLVTACWPRKSDFTLTQLGWELRPIPDTTWDGLVSHYRPLWLAAGQPKQLYHEKWIVALGG